MKCLVFCPKTNSVSKKMATFDDYKYYGYSQDLGLKVCPFNRTHKVKESKYHKHVLKCEQQYPTQHSVSSLKVDKRRLSVLIDDDLTSLKSFGNKSTNSGDSKSIASIRTVDDDHWERIEVLEQTSRRIDLDLKSSLGSNANNDKTNSEVEDLVESITEKFNEIRVDVIIENRVRSDVTDSGYGESDINVVKTIVNEDKSENSCQSNAEKTEESVTNEKAEEEDWNCGAKEFVLIPEKSSDQLTDEDIMQMADTFIDPLIVAKMSKQEKKIFNEKLVKVTKQKSEQKLKALNDLMKYSDDCDTELQTIPDSIRMPRFDIKRMINHYKMIKKGLHQNKTCNQSQCSKTSESVNSVPSAQSVAPVLQHIELETKELVDNCFSVICGGCKDSIDLKTCEVKKLIVYCQKCCGFKFGGYFECIPCNLYGYFAKKQIEDHMFRHYPQKVTVMEVNGELIANSVMN